MLAGALAALGATTASAVTPTLEDFSGPAFQILAPGQDGSLVPTEHSSDQGALYDALTVKQGAILTKDVENLYVSEKFGVTGSILREESTGRAGLTIQRDKNDIPHIYGTTRSDVMFGSGWVAAEDRGLLLRLGLGPAYTAALDVPGINPFGLLLTQRSFKPSAQAINYVEQQKNVLLEQGAKGAQVLEDLENWVEGVNAYEASVPPQQRLIPPVSVTDAIAGFAFIGSIFGNGGGGEVANSDLLARLEAKYGAEEGLKIFHDLREVNDPEAPTTTSKAFPYDQVPSGPTPGSPVIDAGSPSASAVHAAAVAKASRRKASNFLLVGHQLSNSGNPLAVMGPQLGYFYPEIVMQADLHGGGIDAQGVIAPIAPYVFIGRGKDFAWSLTSAGSQNTMQFLEKLCNPDASPPTRTSDHYVYKGECVPMTTVDAGELGASGSEPAHEVFFKETVHGPVTGTVTVGGEPYAIAKDRSTRGREPVGEIAFSDLDSNVVHSPEQFFGAANELETTFNMSYLDNQHIAYFSTGRLPVLAAGTDPSLPTLGTGEYDWKGFLTQEQHPHEIDPASATFLNWNNKPAPEWGAASDQYSYGPVQRVQLYTGFKAKMNEAKDVSIMNRAALQDLRALKVWPVINQVLATGAAPSKLAEEAAALVTAWTEKGASRAGLNRPGNPGAAVMDAIWTPIAEAVLSPVLGEVLPELKSIASPDNPPSSTGSSFDGGWYGYVYKDLRSLLGTAAAQPYSRAYCGNGSLEACRASLWGAIQTAAEGLAATQGSEPKKWRAASVRINFPPDPLLGFTMRWTNRSTFQQVITFTGHAP
ncbi:MAG TPA: penicillin acylase family protein [Solirubrobacteraceae bacterium]